MRKSKSVHSSLLVSIDRDSIELDHHDENTSAFIEERLLQNRVLKKLIDQLQVPATLEVNQRKH